MSSVCLTRLEPMKCVKFSDCPNPSSWMFETDKAHDNKISSIDDYYWPNRQKYVASLISTYPSRSISQL